MHALSVRQPWADAIANGTKRDEYRTWAPRALIGRDLLIVASRTTGPGYAGEPIGVAICVVHVDAMRARADDYAWRLSNPRRVSPVPIKGCAALWHVDDAIISFGGSRAPIVDVDVRPLPSAKRAPRERSAPRPKRKPYVLRCGRIIVGELRDPLRARTLAAEIATARGRDVDVERDGFHLYTSHAP